MLELGASLADAASPGTHPRSVVRASSTCASRRKWRAAPAAASTRAAISSTTRSPRFTRPCAARTRMRRCTGSAACSTAAATRCTSRGAWCAWRSRMSGSRTRAPLHLTLDAWEAYDRLGSPEGELAIANAVVYLAVAPKSNAVYVAMSEAKEDVERFGTLDVPAQVPQRAHAADERARSRCGLSVCA